MEKWYEDNWSKKGKISISGQKFRGGTGTKTGPNRTQSVPVPIQVVPVPPYRMCMVPVPNRVVPVPQCPKCPYSYNFAYLSQNHTSLVYEPY